MQEAQEIYNGSIEELKEARKEAWSWPGPDHPPGDYIGSVSSAIAGRTFFFYRNGQDYYYETDYDMSIRHEQKLKRRRRYQ